MSTQVEWFVLWVWSAFWQTIDFWDKFKIRGLPWGNLLSCSWWVNKTNWRLNVRGINRPSGCITIPIYLWAQLKFLELMRWASALKSYRRLLIQQISTYAWVHSSNKSFRIFQSKDLLNSISEISKSLFWENFFFD